MEIWFRLKLRVKYEIDDFLRSHREMDWIQSNISELFCLFSDYAHIPCQMKIDLTQI